MILKVKMRGLENIRNVKQKVKQATQKAVKAADQKYYREIHKDIDAGKSFTPKTGNLQQSITIRFEDSKAVIGTHKEYAPFVEFGTRAHKIVAKGRALKIPTKDGYIFRKKVNHPGSKPYPFLYLNFENRKKLVKKVFEKTFKEVIDE